MGRDFFGNFPIVAGLGFSRDIKVLDDCEGAMTWIVSGTAGDRVAANEAAAAFEGSYGLHLKTRTTGAAENDTLQVQKLFDYPASGLLIARARIAPVTPANCKAFDWYLRIDDGAQQYLGMVRLDFDGNKVYYANSAGNPVEIAAMATTFTTLIWYSLELAIDCRAKKYLTVRFNGFEADLSAQGLYNDAATAGRCAQLYTNQTAGAGGPADVYLDNIYCGEIPEA